jgi:hypothetical protein
MLSLGLSLFSSGRDAFQNAAFNLSPEKRGKEAQLIESAIKNYNKYATTFYNTGDYIRGLTEIPADALLKKRLVQDINMLKNDGLVMVFDRDRVTLRDVSFRNRQFAVAVTEEVWLIALQDTYTRKPVFNVKGSEIKVRYLLRKEEFHKQGEKWIIHEADVYPGAETVPELNVLPVL